MVRSASMMRAARAALLGGSMLSAACLAVRSPTDYYLRGRREFEARNWAAAGADLGQFINQACPHPSNEDCIRACWMHGNAEAALGHPAHALEDFIFVDKSRNDVIDPAQLEAARAQLLRALAQRRAAGPEVGLRLTCRYAMPPGYSLGFVKVFLDGQTEPLAQFAPVDFVDGLASFDTKVEPGDHFIRLHVFYDGGYQGHKDYRANVLSIHDFNAIPGQPRQIGFVLHDQGGSLHDLPAIKITDDQ
jgi:hypothetical protein